MTWIQRKSTVDAVTVVTDEPEGDLQDLASALSNQDIALQVTHADDVRPSMPGVIYLRRIDPELADPHRYARTAYLSAAPERTLNAPGAVHIAEWAPLAARALDEARVPQPRRIWCFDVADATRAAEVLGFPITVERICDRRRLAAADEDELRDAVERLADRSQGVLLEQAIRVELAYSVMVVDGAAVCAHGCRIDDGARDGTYADVAERLAVRAVWAIGGTAMAVDVRVDGAGHPSVQRILPAPELEAFGPAAIAAVVDALGVRRKAIGRGARRTGRVAVPA